MNTVSFESPVTTYLPVSRTSCVPTTSRIFLRSLDRDQSSHRYRCYLHYRHAIRSCSKVSRTARCFTASIIFYTSSGIFAGSRLNEHDFDSFCAPIISRFERRSWTLTLKKKKVRTMRFDRRGERLIRAVDLVELHSPFCSNLHESEIEQRTWKLEFDWKCE